MDQDKLDREVGNVSDRFYQWEQTARVLFNTTIGYADLLQQEEHSKDLSDQERREYANIIFQSATHLRYQWSRVSSYLRLRYGEKIVLEAIEPSKVIAEVLAYFDREGVDVEIVTAVEDNLPLIRGHSDWLFEAILGCLTDWYYPTRRYEEKFAHTIKADLVDKNIVKVQVYTVSSPDSLFYPSTGIDVARLVVKQLGGEFELDHSHESAEVCFTLLPWDDAI
jgi:hypothetical protein